MTRRLPSDTIVGTVSEHSGAKVGSGNSPTTERKKMNAIAIGQEFETQRSHEKVKALEVIENKNGSLRVFVENTNGERRWTTVR